MSRWFIRFIRGLPGMKQALNGALCYGHELMLLHSRKWVLQHAGCPTDYVLDKTRYRAILENSPPGVIILCQTLSPEECRAACEIAETCSAESRLLLLSFRTLRCVPRQLHRTLEGGGNPRLFAQTVLELLHQHAPAA